MGVSHNFRWGEISNSCFWDTRKGALILTTHGFIKKSEKVPRKEIKKAERIRKIYFNQNV